jgi:caa(3)-type oxidase subunit IV
MASQTQAIPIHANYVKIYITLVTLAAMSMLGPTLGIPALTLITAFGIALVKATMVAAYFMHLNIERRYIWFLLFISGVMLWRANRTFAELRDAELTRKLLGLAMGFGAFFVVFQGYEWTRLIEFGLTMQSSTYGAFFYLIVGAHALHAVAALVALGYCHLRLIQGELTRETFSTT